MLEIKDILDHIIIKQKKYADQLDKALEDDGISVFQNYIEMKTAIEDELQDSINVHGYRYKEEDLSDYCDNVTKLNMMLRTDSGPSAIQHFLSEDDIRSMLKRKRKKIVTEYVEYNAYYRELLGLPPMKRTFKTDPNTNGTYISYEEDENAYVYIDEPITGMGDIEGIPVHKLSYNQKLLLYNYKWDKELLRKYPYLKNISKNMNIIDLRDASYFDIIWHDISRSLGTGKLLPYLYNYRVVKNYFLHNYFSEYDTIYTEYFERIQCMILFMATLANTNAGYPREKLNISNLTTEEVYNILASFGVPKFNFSPKYLNRLASRLSELIYKKGTNNALNDLTNMFNEIKIFKYFLVKNINQGQDTSEDKERYSLSYVRADLLDDTPFKAMDDPNNYVPYMDVVNKDSKWLDPTRENDTKLEQYLKESDFSWAESKYIGIDSTVHLGWLSTKAALLYRWMIDNKNITSKYKIYYDYLDIDTDIYSLFIYLQCLLFYKYKRKPSIPDNLGTYFKIFTISEQVDLRSAAKLLGRIYSRSFTKDGEPVNDHIRRLLASTTRFSDLNTIADDFFDKYHVDDKLTHIMNKTMHLDEEEDIKHKSYYNDGNNPYTIIDDDDFINKEEKNYKTALSDGIDISKRNKRGLYIKETINFLTNLAGGNYTAGSMYNNYSKFEVNCNIIQVLYEMRSLCLNYKEYEMINLLLEAFTTGEKLSVFKDKYGRPFNSLVDYLVSLNPGNNIKFAHRISELTRSEEDWLSIFNAEIIEVLILLRDKSMLRPSMHTETSDTFEYLQKIYTDSEVSRYLITMIDFFKSYTQDLISKYTTYILEDADNTIHILEDMVKTHHIKEWDLGSMAILLGQFPTETLRHIRDVLAPHYTIYTSERLERKLPVFNKYYELASDGLHLT